MIWFMEAITLKDKQMGVISGLSTDLYVPALTHMQTHTHIPCSRGDSKSCSKVYIWWMEIDDTSAQGLKASCFQQLYVTLQSNYNVVTFVIISVLYCVINERTDEGNALTLLFNVALKTHTRNLRFNPHLSTCGHFFPQKSFIMLVRKR